MIGKAVLLYFRNNHILIEYLPFRIEKLKIKIKGHPLLREFVDESYP